MPRGPLPERPYRAPIPANKTARPERVEGIAMLRGP
jgi:hypothetical protein